MGNSTHRLPSVCSFVFRKAAVSLTTPARGKGRIWNTRTAVDVRPNQQRELDQSPETERAARGRNRRDRLAQSGLVKASGTLIFGDGRSWSNRRLQPKPAFSCFAPVHRTALTGQLGVERDQRSSNQQLRLRVEPTYWTRLKGTSAICALPPFSRVLNV